MRTSRIPVDRSGEHVYPARTMLHDTALQDFSAYGSAAREVERLLAGDTALLERPVPHISAWAPVQHAAHVTLANELVLRNLVNLAKGSGMLVLTEAEQNPQALAVLTGGVLPRGEAKAPRMVTPPLDIDVAVAREWAAKFSADLAALRATIEIEHTPRCFVPHQVLGPLNLAQWIRFGLVHTRHHLAIAREVMAVSS